MREAATVEETSGRPAVSQARDDHPSRGRHSGGRSAYPDHRRHSLMQSAHAVRVADRNLALPDPNVSIAYGRTSRTTRLWFAIVAVILIRCNGRTT